MPAHFVFGAILAIALADGVTVIPVGTVFFGENETPFFAELALPMYFQPETESNQ